MPASLHHTVGGKRFLHTRMLQKLGCSGSEKNKIGCSGMQLMVAIPAGNPFGLDHTLTSGIISGTGEGLHVLINFTRIS